MERRLRLGQPRIRIHDRQRALLLLHVAAAGFARERAPWLSTRPAPSLDRSGTIRSPIMIGMFGWPPGERSDVALSLTVCGCDDGKTSMSESWKPPLKARSGF
jgi:hypothetical protein